MNFLKKEVLKVILWSYGDEGKTSLMYKGFKCMKDIQTIPTIGINFESIVFNGVSITFLDIGGGFKIKELRNNYFPSSDAIIFLIDSSLPIEDDYSKYNVEELKMCVQVIEDKPLLIAITKIDKRKVSTFDIIKAYQLDNLYQRKKKFGIIECSCVTSEGIKEIEYWLTSIVK